MRHRRSGRKLSRTGSHRDALFMNLAGALITHGRIKTTEAKAKSLRPYVERLVTRARVDSVHNRRIVAKSLRMHDKASAKAVGEKTIIQRLFEDIAPRFVDRPGGYTRIVKLGSRPGDAAPVVFIEWVDFVPEARDAHSHSHDGGHAHSHDHANEAVAAG